MANKYAPTGLGNLATAPNFYVSLFDVSQMKTPQINIDFIVENICLTKLLDSSIYYSFNSLCKLLDSLYIQQLF